MSDVMDENNKISKIQVKVGTYYKSVTMILSASL